MAIRIAALGLLALGGSIVVEQPQSDMVSRTGGLPVMETTLGETYALADAGSYVWAMSSVDTVNGVDAGPPDAGPARYAGPARCAPIAARIAHRREWLDGVYYKSQQVGWEKAAQAYCEQHPGDVECDRPPLAMERELADVIVEDPTAAAPEFDAWILRWRDELARCARPPKK
jgi:hypothetical protein